MRQILFAIVMISLYSCETTKDCCVPPPENVLPLQVGNYWLMKNISEPSQGTGDELKKYIDAEVLLGTRSYFRMVNRWTFAGGGSDFDTTYYRIGERGFVYERNADSAHEMNVFRLYASEGEQWVYGSGLITLTSIDKHTVFETAINNCRFYFFDAPEIVDEETTTVLAPDIGFVGIYTFASNLQTFEASVYGEVHHFD